MAHRSRVVAVIVLLIVAAAALHGYLPGAHPPPRERQESGSASVFAVVAMLVVSMAIIAIAVVTQSKRKPVGFGADEPPRRLPGKRRPLTWRMVAIALAVVIAWLLVVALLSRLDTRLGLESTPTTGTPPGAAQPAGQQQPQPSSSVFSVLAAATMALMMSVFVGAAILGRRQRRRTVPVVSGGDEYHSAPVVSGSDPFARAAEVGLAEIEDRTREPRAAIIACYAAMERELENSPEIVPRESDTPSEVLARAVEHRALGVDTAIELVDLFEEARFSPHVMTEDHREAAVGVLTLVLAELRSAA